MSIYDIDTSELIGRTITRIRMNEDYLVFDTDAGEIAYTVEGDCCSHSYFFDFYGVRNVLDNGPVSAFEEVELSPGDPGYHPDDCLGYQWDSEAGAYKPNACGRDHDQIAVYGLRLTTKHPVFGPVSSVFSFRNDSNGYYGGWMRRTSAPVNDLGDLEDLTADKVG